MRRRNRSDRPLRAGDAVKITAHVAGPGDGSLRGEGGRVVGSNPHYRHADSGQIMTAVELDNGQVVTVPAKALKRE